MYTFNNLNLTQGLTVPSIDSPGGISIGANSPNITIGATSIPIVINGSLEVKEGIITQTPTSNLQSANKLYVDSINSNLLYTNFKIKQNTETINYSIYAVKVKDMITLFFPELTINLTNNTEFVSFIISENTLKPLHKYIYSVAINDKISFVKFKNNYLNFSTAGTNWDTGSNIIQPFSITYRSLNSDKLTGTVWGSEFPDLVGPTVLSSTVGTPLITTAGQTIQVVVVFDKEIKLFNADDISVNNGTVSSITTANNITFSINFTSNTASNGSFSLQVIRVNYTDLSDNIGGNGSLVNLGSDALLTINTFAIQSGGLITTNPSTRTISIIFSEVVLNFGIADFNVTNGVLSNFTGSGSTYTVDFTTSTDGAYTINILPNNYTDAGLNLGIISNILSLGFAGVNFNMVNSDYGVYTQGSRYSMFKHNSSYANSAVQISSSSTGANNLTDIGFVGDKLDLTTYNSFIATYGTAYLSKFYDQYGSNHIIYTTRPTFMKNGKTYPRPIFNGSVLSNSLTVPNLLVNCASGIYIKFRAPTAAPATDSIIFGGSSGEKREIKINTSGQLSATLKGYSNVPTNVGVSAGSICDGNVHELQIWQYGSDGSNNDEIYLDGVQILTRIGTSNGSSPGNIDIGSNFTGEIYALFIHCSTSGNYTSLAQNNTTRANFTSMFNLIATELD
jgi:hypothetical protein